MPHRIFAWAILIFLFSSAPAWSWSAKGHRLVGAVADEVLKKSPTTKAKGKDIPKKAVKCDMCRDLPGGAACVRACPTGAAIRVSPDEFLNLAEPLE